MFCHKCSSLIEEGRDFCVRCYTPVERRGIARRLWDRLMDWCGRRGHGMTDQTDFADRTIKTTYSIQKSSSITVHDERSGGAQTYGTISDLPPELRGKVEAALSQASASSPKTSNQASTQVKIEEINGRRRYSYMKDGRTFTAESVDQLPPEARQAFESVAHLIPAD